MTSPNAEHAQQNSIPRSQIRELQIGRSLVTCYLNGLLDLSDPLAEIDDTLEQTSRFLSVVDTLRANVSRRIMQGAW